MEKQIKKAVLLDFDGVITDTLGDIIEAEKCQVKSICVSWGYHPASTLLKGNPLQIVNKPEELINAINSYLAL